MPRFLLEALKFLGFFLSFTVKMSVMACQSCLFIYRLTAHSDCCPFRLLG